MLAPSTSVLSSGNDMIPKPKVIVIESEGKPPVYFSAPNRLVINSLRPSSHILTDANPKDPTIKSRVKLRVVLL